MLFCQEVNGKTRLGSNLIGCIQHCALGEAIGKKMQLCYGNIDEDTPDILYETGRRCYIFALKYTDTDETYTKIYSITPGALLRYMREKNLVYARCEIEHEPIQIVIYAVVDETFSVDWIKEGF